MHDHLPLPPDFPEGWQLNQKRGVTWYHYQYGPNLYPVLQRAMDAPDVWRVVAKRGDPNKVYEYSNDGRTWEQARTDLVAALLTVGFS